VQDRHYQVPAEDGGILLDPPRNQLAGLLETNREALAALEVSLAGKPLRELRSEVRRDALAAAARYLTGLGLPAPALHEGPLVVTGHQPAFYHPGVWFKNFLTQWLARQVPGLGLNLVVDNDEARKPGLDLPVRRGGEAQRIEVLLGPPLRGLPYEEWRLADPAAPQRFAREVLSRLEHRGMREAFAQFARYLEAACREHPDMASFMTAARCRYEALFEVANLELPLSRMCELPGFAHFFAHVLAELPRFRECYNGALEAYRRRRRIRNRANPLPDLAQGDGWLEAPFWVWRGGEPRRALRVGLAGDDRVLRDGDQEILRLSAEEVSDGRLTAERLEELRRAGYKVRTRALTTTLFARLVLGDLFIHGVGGGNYDQITDEVIRTFFGVEPPGYAVASATVCLPLARKGASREEVTRLLYLIRDLHYNPDRHLPPELRRDPEVERLIRTKWEYIGREGKTPLERREIFVTIRRVNAELKARLGEAPGEAERALRRAREALATDAVLGSRAYAFCLYPQRLLRGFYRRVLP